MFKDDESVRCRCTDKNYSSYAENDSDLDDAPDTRVQNAKENSNISNQTKFSLDNVAHGDMSRKSIAVEVLKETDADRLRKISTQNLKLSVIFPEASALLNNNFNFVFLLNRKNIDT